jgi:hypothetical protein
VYVNNYGYNYGNCGSGNVVINNYGYGGCGHVSYGGVCGGCSGTGSTFYMSSYYSSFSYSSSVSVGFCFNGIYNGSYAAMYYPTLDAGCSLVTCGLFDDYRVVVLDAPCGSYHWRIVEQQVWVPGYWQRSGCCNRDWVPGYYTWQEVSCQRVAHYTDCAMYFSSDYGMDLFGYNTCGDYAYYYGEEVYYYGY